MRRLLAVLLALATAAAIVVGISYLGSDAVSGVRVGDPAPDLAVRVLQGGHPSGIPLLGQAPVLLVFFDNGPESVVWIRSAERLQRRYGLEGLAVVGVNVYENPKDAIEYVNHHDVQFTVLHDPGGAASRAAYGSPSAPHAYLMDSGGRVVKAYRRVADLTGPDSMELVASLLPRPSPAPHR